MLGRAILQVNCGWLHAAARNLQQNTVRNHDLFLAQKIEVGVTAGASIDDGGKVVREIVGTTDHGKTLEKLMALLARPGAWCGRLVLYAIRLSGLLERRGHAKGDSFLPFADLTFSFKPSVVSVEWSGLQVAPRALLTNVGFIRKAERGIAEMHKASDLAASVPLKLEFLRFTAVLANAPEHVPTFGLEKHHIAGWVCARQSQ
jgi:hypothetical protein